MEDAGGVLGDIRVLDLADEKGLYCTKLLADLGAEVIKIEKPGGDPTRFIGPFYHDQRDPQKSLYWFQFNTNKRSITLNLMTPEGKEILKKLVKTADVLVETYPPGYLEDEGLGYRALKEINPGLILASITPFGQTGPYRGYQATDLVAQAMGGIMYLAGFPDDPPNRLYGSQAYHMASVQAMCGIQTALYVRDRGENGQQVDVSMQEAVAIAQESAMQTFDLRGEIRQRTGYSGLVPAHPGMGTFACKDGYVNIFMFTGQWLELLEWMGSEGMAGDLKEKHPDVLEKLNDYFAIFGLSMDPEAYGRFLKEQYPPFDEHLRAFLKSHTKEELYNGAQQRRLQLSMVSTIEDLLENPQLKALGYFVEVEHAELGDILTYPGAPYHLSETPWRIRRRAPLIGEDNEEVYGKELGFSKTEILDLKQKGII
ncbi:MAG: CoA transferase [Deltaproteobacteria bacterium]|nr:CoA transferase [Deltaproteobacteria bacterium]